MHTVQDGVRVFKFEGEELARSSSYRKGKDRWVEFRLFRTARGQYVLSRIGISIIYHDNACPVVRRNDIYPVPAEAISQTLLPCVECRPTESSSDTFYPETPRYWAQKSETAEGVVESLYQYDATGARYLTNVAKDLLVAASQKDGEIAEHYYVEYID